MQAEIDFSPPHNGTRTSRAAATSMRHRAASDRARVLEFVASRRSMGATCDEAERELRMTHQSCSARFTELRQRHRICDSGRTRATRSGRPAVVWWAVDAHQ